MSSHLSAANPNFRKALAGAAAAVGGGGGTGSPDAMHRAYALLQASVLRQASMLAYIDNFWLLGVAILVMVPLVFLMKRPPTGGTIAVH